MTSESANGDRRALSLVRSAAASAPFASIRRGWFGKHPFHWSVSLQDRATTLELQGTLKKDGCDHYRCMLYETIRSHFGPVAAEHLKTRLGFASCKKVIAWDRRARFMPSYPELLDPVPLAVAYITPELLLQHAFGRAIEKSAVLVRFRRSRDREGDLSILRGAAPWLLDLPESEEAIDKLRCYGWLLLACEDNDQAGLLVGATQTLVESKRLAVREIIPARIAGQSKEDIWYHYLRGLDGVLDRCLW
ncbi:MAG TPA: hypothetical protein VEW48_25500 [Thermoanaerobaculia bacterium]|nr:hypothetical protein [Thermoanaerobaculia bacterium]